MGLTKKLFTFLLILAIAVSKDGCPKPCRECAGPFRDFCVECEPRHYLEKGDCYPCHESCGWCNGPLKSDCLPENFYNIINTHRVLASGNTTALAYTATLQDGFTLNYDYSSDNSSIIILINYTLSQGWFGIGFGSSMNDADIIVCFPGSGAISCADYWCNSETTPSKDSATGGTDDLVILGYDTSNGINLVKFQRNLTTGDSKDKVIVQGPNSMIWAFHKSSASFIQHTDVGSATVDLTPSTNTDPPESDEDPVEMTHGLLIFFGWGVAIDIGLIFMALGKKYPFYILLHSLTMWYTVVSTIVTEGIMIYQNGTGGDDQVSNSHFAIGIAILTLMILQHIGGITLVTISKGKKISNPFHKMRFSHRLNGLLIYLLAKTNIFIGVYLYDGLWWNWMIPIEATLMALNILVRIWIKCRSTKYQPLVSPASKPAITPFQSKIVADINLGKSREELLKTFPKTKFAYLFNRVYDLSAFEHPGGNFIISAVKGREIGRFLYGAYQLEASKHKAFHHKTTDISLLNRFYIGDIIQGENSILEGQDKNSCVTPDFVNWNYVKKVDIMKHVANFEFNHPSYQIKNNLRGVSWFGRHFYLAKDLVKGPVRPYTICLSLGESWSNFRTKAIEFFDLKVQGNGNAAFTETLPSTANNLNFVVKCYNNPKSQALSAFLHSDLKGSKSLLINGPVGTGLELSNTSKGVHYVFAVGTGILPFIDLLNFILFKSMYLALKKQFGKTVADQINPHGDEYETALSGGFKLELFVAYAGSEDTIGYEIIKKAAEINKKFELSLFEAHVKGIEDSEHVNKIPKRIDRVFLGEKINKDSTKFYVCGSPSFNQVLPDSLKKLGVDPLKITLV